MKIYLLHTEVYHHFSGLSLVEKVNSGARQKLSFFAIYLFIIVIIISFFRRVFSECTEAITTSLIPLDIILPEICAFILGFRCTVWDKMNSLACSLADGVPVDSILISPRPMLPPTNIGKGRVLTKSTDSSNTKTSY